MINQQRLNDYFGGTWRATGRTVDEYNQTGLTLATKVKSSDRVLDVGCGLNPFKGLINVVGIDPAFPEADLRLTLEEYAFLHPEEKFNVAFCLGSINFGSREVVEHQIDVLTHLLTDDAVIYWRCNPGLQDHNNNECQFIEFYPWSFDEHERLAEKFGFVVEEASWDSFNRIYAMWRRNEKTKTSATGTSNTA